MGGELKEITKDELEDLSIEELVDIKVETEDIIMDLEETISNCDKVLNL